MAEEAMMSQGSQKWSHCFSTYVPLTFNVNTIAELHAINLWKTWLSRVLNATSKPLFPTPLLCFKILISNLHTAVLRYEQLYMWLLDQSSGVHLQCRKWGLSIFVSGILTIFPLKGSKYVLIVQLSPKCLHLQDSGAGWNDGAWQTGGNQR